MFNFSCPLGKTIQPVRNDTSPVPSFFGIVIRILIRCPRSQIYEIATKNETGGFCGDGRQNKLAGVHPSYEVAPISDNRVPEAGQDVKRFSYWQVYEPGTEYLRNVSTQTIADNAVNIFGRTFKWNETGWITPNGTKLDFSDRRWGGTGGYRTEDHESIWEAYPEEGRDINGKDAEVDFMARGGIRVLPESGGINLSTQPTEQQKTILKKEYCKEVHIMNKEAIIRKLTSRKRWLTRLIPSKIESPSPECSSSGEGDFLTSFLTSFS